MNSQRDAFQLPEEISYLNCAYMSPQLRSVEEVGHAMLTVKNQPYLLHPGDFFSRVHQLKGLFSRLVNAGNPARIAVIPSVSYGMANVANNVALSAGQQIVVAGEEFPSNFHIWKRLADKHGGRLKIVAAPESEQRTEAWNTALLEAIDPGTALVAISHVHWTDGTRFDLAAIRRRSREVGALLVVDGTQSVGALPFDVSYFQPDALICAGYKWLLGPYSVGLGYYGPAFDHGEPIEENWINRLNSEDFQHLANYEEEYQPLAGRYSVGEHSNFVLVPMLQRSLEQLLEWGVADIQQYCRDLSREPLARLEEMGAKVEAEEQRCGHLFGVRLGDRFDPEALRRQFQQQHVYVSLRGDAIRISPHVYNYQVDFLRLVGCFEGARRKKVF